MAPGVPGALDSRKVLERKPDDAGDADRAAVRVQQQKLGQGYWPPAEHDLLAIG
jgi:hypothetical protein